MSGDPGALAALARLADAGFAARQARLGALRTQEAALRGKLAALDAGRSARAQTLGGAGDAALRAGADLLWQGWVDGRRRALNIELSRNLALQEIARAQLAQAFGRMQASRELLRQAAGARARAAARRAELGG